MNSRWASSSRSQLRSPASRGVSLTTPLLILLLGIPAKESVGTALIFGAVVKVLTAPVYLVRKQVSGRALCICWPADCRECSRDRFLLHGIRASVMMAVLGFTIMSVALLNFSIFHERARGRIARTGSLRWDCRSARKWDFRRLGRERWERSRL